MALEERRAAACHHATELAQQIGAVEVGSIVAWKMSLQSDWKVDWVELGVDDASFATHAILSTRRRWSLRGPHKLSLKLNILALPFREPFGTMCV